MLVAFNGKEEEEYRWVFESGHWGRGTDLRGKSRVSVSWSTSYRLSLSVSEVKRKGF